ncbi:MAG: pilus assembly protein PilM [Phycisphaerae bacterium]
MIDVLRSPIGLDFGARRIRAMQLTRKPGGWRVAAATAYPRLEPGQPVSAREVHKLVGILDRQGFRGEQVVTALPGDSLLSGILDVPHNQEEHARQQVARAELARMHELSGPQVEMTCWELPRNNNARSACQVMAVGYAHDRANALLDVLAEGGLDVVALDARNIALCRAITPLRETPESILGLLDIRWDYAKLSMLYQDRIAYERRIEQGGLSSLYKALADQTNLSEETFDYLLGRLDLSEPEAEQIHDPQSTLSPRAMDEIGEIVLSYVEELCEQMSTPISYVNHQYPGGTLAKVVLAGQVASTRGMGQVISRQLSLPVQLAEVRAMLDCPETLFRCCGPEMAGAVGFCLFSE